MKNVYFERYAWPDRLFPDYKPYIDLELVVVIPCHNEPNISLALKSINACSFNEKFLVIVVVNEGDDDTEAISRQNQKTIDEIAELRQSLKYEVLVSHQKFPPKKAGVGLARKVGMDEVAHLFEQLEKDGIIVCYDADCTCPSNYLRSIADFYSDGKMEAGIVFYEHRLEENKEAIINYELYLRYYIDALRWSGFPYAYQTLGSCITVKSKRYQKEGGMNTRKAGEDFYFLHKVIPNGKFGEINETTIYPSDRISDRVPFGTGHAIDKYLNQDPVDYQVYNPKIFEDLKTLIDQVDALFERSELNLPDSVQLFLDKNKFDQALIKIKKNAPTLEIFRKRFFDWLDGFRILKFVHFARDEFYPNVEVTEAIAWLGSAFSSIQLEKSNKESAFKAIRKFDRLPWFHDSKSLQ